MNGSSKSWSKRIEEKKCSMPKKGPKKEKKTKTKKEKVTRDKRKE